MEYNQNKNKLELKSINSVITREISTEMNYENKLKANKNLMGYLSELESYQMRQRFYSDNYPSLIVHLNQGSIENNLIPLIEMEPFLEKYELVKHQNDQRFDADYKLFMCAFDDHLK